MEARKHKLVLLFFLLFILQGIFIISKAYASEYQQGVEFKGISKIAYNREHKYWLICTFSGEILSYDGKNFRSYGSIGKEIRDAAFFRNRWLIGGGRTLLEFYPDKAKFVNISSDYNILDIECNDEYCLIYADSPEKTSYTKLLKYDGASLSDLTEEIRRAERNWIREMIWNGEYWLISVDAADEMHVVSGTVFKYDGKNFREIMPPQGGAPLIAWNGKYWLIGKGDYLYKYNGIEFEKIEGSKNVRAYKLAYNNGYWLLVGFTSVIKYDENKNNFSVVKKFPYPSDYFPVKVIPAKGYWLILYDIGGEPGYAIAKYDGKAFEFIEYPDLMYSYYAWFPIGDIAWNGEYLLIGTYAYRSNGREFVRGMKYALVKYDGKNFEDLTQEFVKAIEKEKIKTSLNIKENNNGFLIIIPLVILIILLVIYKKQR